MFDSTSRYYPLETAFTFTPDGREVAYKRRRFVPPAPTTSPLIEHAVKQGERLDYITARYLGNPELFWQLCDVNNAMHPDELVSELGHKIRITLLET